MSLYYCLIFVCKSAARPRQAMSDSVDGEVVSVREGEQVRAPKALDEGSVQRGGREFPRERTSHTEEDRETSSCQRASAPSSDREDSEVTRSQASTNSLLEETPSVSTAVNLSEENGLSTDGSLGSTRSDQALSLSEELAEAAVPLPSHDPAGAETAQAAAPGPSQAVPAYYLVKWITWKEKKTPIITQSENGPCPLLAIMNILFLRWKVRHAVSETSVSQNRAINTRTTLIYIYTLI